MPGVASTRLVRLTAACGALLLSAGCTTIGTPPTERGIVVTGVGRVPLRPDIGVIDVGAEARGPRLADATAQVERTMRDMLARVKALGVADADVRTALYAVEPIAEPRQPGDTAGARIVGYRVSNVVQVRSRGVDRLGAIADAAVAAGANVVRNIQFTVDDPSRGEAEARSLAMRDATSKAAQVAAAAGVNLGRLLAVTESTAGRPMSRVMYQAPSGSAGFGPVEPGQLEIMVTVEARYAIEP